jgi:hypothetical protein
MSDPTMSGEQPGAPTFCECQQCEGPDEDIFVTAEFLINNPDYPLIQPDYREVAGREIGGRER